MTDGGADNHSEEIGQIGGTVGIHGMTLCKTEKYSNGFPAEKDVPSCPCGTTLRTIKELRMDADRLFLSEKGSCIKAASVV